MCAAWSWPCSHPAHTSERMVRVYGEVLRSVERGNGVCLVLDLKI